MTTMTDTLFGTRMHTAGAEMQLPRKVPLRIEPKTFMANERTFLSWVHMAVTMGGFSSVLATFAVPRGDPGAPQGPITVRTTQFIALTLIPVALLMIGYGLFSFQSRARYLRKKEMGFFNDQVGPAVLCALVMISLSVILVLTFADFFTYRAAHGRRLI